jgi:hypothetical protein|tara:strand:+ start:143 stop:511 length:369 start_codon:yes stop_codon:yes gene_type:complete
MLLKEIEQQFPYVSVVAYGGAEYVGIISNQDQYVTTMFVYTSCRSDEDKKLLLDLGEIWWWESNRLIPINIFLRREIEYVKYSMMTMNSKDVKVVIGPCVNINNLALKRVKRKSVQLIRRPR